METTIVIPTEVTGPNDRLFDLHSSDIFDAADERAFENIARLASVICEAPISDINLIDKHRNWFKAHVGYSAGITESDVPFCSHTILQDEVMVVPDARFDDRFKDTECVVDARGIRFYAGVPLLTEFGNAIGTLCVIDLKPREFTHKDRQTLRHLADIAVSHLNLRRDVVDRELFLAEQNKAADELKDSQRRLQLCLEVGRVATCEYSAVGLERTHTAGLAMIHGISPDQYPTDFNSYAALIHEDDRQAVLDTVDRAMREAIAYTVRYRIIRPDGELRWLEGRAQPVRDADGTVRGMTGTCVDITERKIAEDSLRSTTETLKIQELQMRQMADNVPVLISRIDVHERFVFANQAYSELFDCPIDNVQGKTMLEVLGKDVYSVIGPNIQRVLRGDSVYFEAVLNYKSVGPRHTRVSYVPSRAADGQIDGFVVSVVDITELKLLEAERERLLAETERLLEHALEKASRDQLTGVLNHRAFHERLEEETERCVREKTSLAVIMVDLDNFKFFNDAYGHQAGDEVLRKLTAALQSCCRPYDCLARFGGDEFALIMPRLGTDDVITIIERLQLCVGNLGYRPLGHSHDIPLAVSAGVAIFPDEADKADVVSLADQRLYRDKIGDRIGNDADLVRRSICNEILEFPMLDALIIAVDNKDRYTRKHCEDVMRWSIVIAKYLNLSEVEQVSLSTAALVLDVGKIGVPDFILRKPGPLTDDEFESVKKHAAMGAAIVATVEGMEPIVKAVKHHHERWDGDGYPARLSGEDIPLEARILAVADSFSAMMSDRPYRKGMSIHSSLAMLRGGAGKQWDTHCVAAILQQFPNEVPESTP